MNRRNFIKTTALVLGIGAATKDTPFANSLPKKDNDIPQYTLNPTAIRFRLDEKGIWHVADPTKP